MVPILICLRGPVRIGVQLRRACPLGLAGPDRYRRANDAIARAETELVPLLHRGGVDLLLITPTTTFAGVGIELGVTGGRFRWQRDSDAQPFFPPPETEATLTGERFAPRESPPVR